MNDNTKAWVAALRSGDYKQGHRRLTYRSLDQEYDCCLGVACKVAIAAGVPVKRREDSLATITYDNYRDFLPPSVQMWLGMRDERGSDPDHRHNSLSGLNDSGVTFERIADQIEARASSLFL
jgi:hypothetical protein